MNTVIISFAELMLQCFIIIGLPVIIPILLIILVNKIKFDEKIKNKVIIAISLIYYFITGFLVFSIMFTILCVPSILSIHTEFLFYTIVILLLLVTFSLLLIPLNIFVRRKTNIGFILYLILIIFAIVLGIYLSKTILNNTFNPIIDWRAFIDL